MKYCAHCGSELLDEAAMCPKCGCAVDGNNNTSVNASQDSWNTLAIVGFVFSFVNTIVGLILSIIGYRQVKQSGEKGKELALAGIIISAVAMGGRLIAYIYVVCIYAALFFSAVGATTAFAIL